MAQVLDVDVEKERISLGMKQLAEGGGGAATAAPRARGASGAGGGVNKGDTLTVTVREVMDGGLNVQAGDDGVTGFVKRTDLGRDRDEQRPERFQVGQKFDAQVIGFDRSKKPNFSIKALQISEEKQAVAQYGSSDSGASLGDILGAALKEAQSAKEEKATKATKAEAKEPKAPKAEAKEPKAAAKKEKAAATEAKADVEESGDEAKPEKKTKKK